MCIILSDYPKMNITWDDAQLFLAVAETKSMSAAARLLKLGQPTISRRIAALEYSLSATLFMRSVEGISLTALGERLLPSAQKMAEWAGEFERAAALKDKRPQGIVRITASPYLCFDFLAPFSASVTHSNPGLSLSLLASMHYLDLARGEADLALRIQKPTQRDLMVVHSLQVANAVFVSRALKAKLPRKPDIKKLPWIAWAPPFESIPPNPQLEALIPDFSPVFTADQFLVQLAAAEAGLGAMVLAQIPHRFRSKAASHLVPLRFDLGAHRYAQLHLVCVKSAFQIPRVRRVAELLVDELKSTTPQAR
jgi:DNA-binding transcriptional LysR family regulator